ncbi:MAG: GTP-binding protein LepA [Candidatus Sumerlaeota bacterium]|nr:GTP-binding protein LepA [Candidatus Sumerlaeota bacterium]
MSDFPNERIRNFSIIAHIDHGKSTLADRLIEMTGTLTNREMRAQVLDSMDLERERGITIKAQAVRLLHLGLDGQMYQLNLIDTPGHVDFTYEVSRSLAACEGALLIVDATQGVEAQTLANVYLALENDLEIIPVINKIDLPSADLEGVRTQISQTVGLDGDHAFPVSAKTGVGCKDLLDAVVEFVPPPKGKSDSELRALIFDSSYDVYRGVISYIRVKDGEIRAGDKIRFMRTGLEYEVQEVGVFIPSMIPKESLACGEVGYVVSGVKTIQDIRVGDTITHARRPAAEPLPGYKEARPVVFAGMYPTAADDYNNLKDAIEKLRLNDASIHVEPEVSEALGFGFRCGFLGLLHMEIIQERLEREYNLDLVFTAPSVNYRITRTDGEVLFIENPAKLPSPQEIEMIEEPYILSHIYFPPDYMGNVMTLCQAKKGIQQSMNFVSKDRVQLVYEFPLAEVVTDFHDKLKAATQGYASFDYDLGEYRPGKLVKMDVLINGEPVDALSVIVHRDDASYRGRLLCSRLRKIVPRQLYAVAIQAAVGGKIVARETVSALRKDVTAKCYGGDISRKRKLLDKQKEGKRRMKQLGNIEIPQEAFMAVLRLDED